jgi:hypothetical protein
LFGPQLKTFHLPTISMVGMWCEDMNDNGTPRNTIPLLFQACSASRVSLCITLLAYKVDVRHVQYTVMEHADWSILSTSEEESPSYALDYPYYIPFWPRRNTPRRAMLLWSVTFAGHL